MVLYFSKAVPMDSLFCFDLHQFDGCFVSLSLADVKTPFPR